MRMVIVEPRMDDGRLMIVEQRMDANEFVQGESRNGLCAWVYREAVTLHSPGSMRSSAPWVTHTQPRPYPEGVSQSRVDLSADARDELIPISDETETKRLPTMSETMSQSETN